MSYQQGKGSYYRAEDFADDMDEDNYGRAGGDVDVDGISPLHACISIGPSATKNGILYFEFDCTNVELKVKQKVTVLVSLLKGSRSLALIEGDDMDGMVETKSFDLYAYKHERLQLSIINDEHEPAEQACCHAATASNDVS